MSGDKTYKGSCFCGEIEFDMTGDPVVMGYCHCESCGGHMYTDHKPMNLIDVYPAVLTGLTFEPSMHVHYQETVLHMPDGLPKFKDLPGEAGGSGELMEE